MQISFPQVAFSPAKMIFIGYVILAALGHIETDIKQFACVSILFFIAQVVHDDFLRIYLNKLADGYGEYYKSKITKQD